MKIPDHRASLSRPPTPRHKAACQRLGIQRRGDGLRAGQGGGQLLHDALVLPVPRQPVVAGRPRSYAPGEQRGAQLGGGVRLALRDPHLHQRHRVHHGGHGQPHRAGLEDYDLHHAQRALRPCDRHHEEDQLRDLLLGRPGAGPGWTRRWARLPLFRPAQGVQHRAQPLAERALRAEAELALGDRDGRRGVPDVARSRILVDGLEVASGEGRRSSAAAPVAPFKATSTPACDGPVPRPFAHMSAVESAVAGGLGRGHDDRGYVQAQPSRRSSRRRSGVARRSRAPRPPRPTPWAPAGRCEGRRRPRA